MSVKMVSQLGAQYIDRYIREREIVQYWRPRLEGQLWRHGCLTMQDYLLLRLQPRIVRLVFPYQKNGDLDQALTIRLAGLARCRVLSAEFGDYCHYAFLYQTLERDLPSSEIMKLSKASPERFRQIIEAAIKHDHLDLALQLLPQAQTLSCYLRVAFQYRRWSMVERLLGPLVNLRPTLAMVISGGRTEDVARFGFTDRLLDPEMEGLHEDRLHELMAATTPAMFDLWYRAVKDHADRGGLLAGNLALIFYYLLSENKQPNLELLEHLEIAYPEMTIKQVARAFEDYWIDIDIPISLCDLVQDGNARLLAVVFRCLTQYRNQ